MKRVLAATEMVAATAGVLAMAEMVAAACKQKDSGSRQAALQVG